MQNIEIGTLPTSFAASRTVGSSEKLLMCIRPVQTVVLDFTLP